MNAFEAYSLYISLKSHFTSKSYDFIKFNGKSRASVSSFESRQDKSFFYKIANTYPSKQKLTDLFISNFINNPNIWIGDLLDEEAEEIYVNWQKRIEGLTYHFQEECNGFLGWLLENKLKFDDLFKVHQNDHPIIVKMALQKKISLETFLILDKLLGFGKKIDSKLKDIIWKDLWFKVGKYSVFIDIDVEKCKKTLRNMIETEYTGVL